VDRAGRRGLMIAPGPAAAILLGPTTGNNYAFIDQLYAAGLKGFFDGVSVHTDTGCLVNDPGLFYRDPLGHIGQYTFLGYRSIREVMLAHRDYKPIWMTELGWSTSKEICNSGAWAGQKPGGVSPRRNGQKPPISSGGLRPRLASKRPRLASGAAAANACPTSTASQSPHWRRR